MTVTLPVRILNQMKSIDSDRAVAISKAVDAITGYQEATTTQIELVEMSRGVSFILVAPNESLRSIPWLKMIEVTPTRHLLTIAPGTSIEKVELTLMDLIETAKISQPHEVSMLETLRAKFGQMRRGQMIQKAEILLVVTKP